MTGQRLAIVDDTPGVTRDRLYGQCEWRGRTFNLVDTGGIEPRNDNEMLLFMRRQAEIAVETADVIIMVTDVKVGVTAADADVAAMLQRAKKPVVLAVQWLQLSHPLRGATRSNQSAMPTTCLQLTHPARDAIGHF